MWFIVPFEVLYLIAIKSKISRIVKFYHSDVKYE